MLLDSSRIYSIARSIKESLKPLLKIGREKKRPEGYWFRGSHSDFKGLADSSCLRVERTDSIHPCLDPFFSSYGTILLSTYTEVTMSLCNKEL